MEVQLSVVSRSVVIVEDELFIRSMLADGLRARGFQVETASSVIEARKIINRLEPDAVLLDIDLGYGANGLDLGESLLLQFPEIAVVYLTVLADPRLSSGTARKANPRAAYLNKRSIASIDSVEQALDAVLRDANLENFRDDRKRSESISELTNSQIEVLRMIATGLTNQQIADARGKSLSATETLITRAFHALGINPSSSENARVIATREFLKNGGMPATNE